MEIKKMDTATLEKRFADVSEEIANVKTQIDFAKSDAAATGEYSSRDWFNRARHALRMKGREHQLIMQELGKRRKEERRARNDSVERRFMEAAKRRLDHDLFMNLVEEANDDQKN